MEIRTICAAILASAHLVANPFEQLSIVKPSNPVLNQRAEEVSDPKAPEIRDLISQMFEIAQGNREESQRGLVGLAAPQVGVSKRVILVDTGVNREDRKFGTLEVFINPKIIDRSQEEEEGPEGCFSVDDQLVGIVSRAKRVVVEALDREGAPVTVLAEGFTARIFQHEIDHLEGIRFPERVGKDGRLHRVSEAQREEYRANWKTWPHLFLWEEWLAMKGEVSN